MNDLISEGNMALIHAAENFDSSRGLRFIAYAEAYIRRAIERALNEQAGIYRLPKNETNPMEQYNSRPFSVDAPLVEGKSVSLLSVLHDEDAPEADEELVAEDRKSTRLNSSHANISYAVFCLKKNYINVFHS